MTMGLPKRATGDKAIRPGSPGGKAILLGFLGSMLLAIAAAASDAAPRSCAATGLTAEVAAVIDDLDLALEDGRTLQLAGIDPARATPTRPGLGEDARRDLESRLVGRQAIIQSLSPTSDRWDRFPAVVRLPGVAGQGSETGPEGLSLNEALVAAGWARARPDPRIRPCFASLLTLEARARNAGLGLWADPYYSVMDADDRNGLSQRTGTMALVEGRVRLSERRGRLYLRLGGPPSDFVAVVAQRAAKTMVGAGLDLRKLGGAKIRVRGFLDDRFGQRIEITDAGQIEVLEVAEPGMPAAPPRWPDRTEAPAPAN